MMPSSIKDLSREARRSSARDFGLHYPLEAPNVESRKIAEGVVLDYDEAGNLVGIVIDNARQRVAFKEPIFS